MKVCDVVTINAPLPPETENMFNETLLSKIKRGAFLINTARAKMCDRDAIVRGLEDGQLAGASRAVRLCSVSYKVMHCSSRD